MKIGIYGGTFNPPHLGHLRSARAAVEALELDKLFFIPALDPPHKELPAGSPTPEQRLAMAAWMADLLSQELGRPGFAEALDLELKRVGKSYTADTVSALHGQYPGDTLWLLMGSDMFLTLQNWYAPERILAQSSVGAFARAESDDLAVLERQGALLGERFGAVTRVLALPAVTEVSSTQLREELRAGAGAELLPQSIYGYILRHGLYGVEKDLKHLTDEELRCASYSMMKAKRIPHVKGTEQAAVALARRWGADEEKARRAAILHDCTKYLTLEEHKAICARYGVTLDAMEQQAVKLLHSKSGACVARYVFGMDEDIYEAIFWHTTGKANMSALEKVIYLADYMEPTRAFPGVEELRERAEQSLDAAVLLGLEMSVRDLHQRGVELHPNTRGAWEYLKEALT